MQGWTVCARTRSLLLAGCAAAAISIAGGASQASAQATDFAYQDCVTAETETGPNGTGACTAISSASPAAVDSGLDRLRSDAVSPDGASLYTASVFDDAVARFDRDPTTGQLTYRGCITGETETGPNGSGACSQISTAASTGTNSGLDEIRSVVLSPDGEWLYAASTADDAIARFERDPATGQLSYRDCITGEAQSGPSGSNACVQIPSATSTGSNSGLDSLLALAMSPDGKSLYAATHLDDSVAHFDRDSATGQLTYRGCITGKSQAGPSGSNACSRIASAKSGGASSGLDSLSSLAISPNGGSVYASSELDDSVARFDRDATNGQLTYRNCITGETQSGPSGSSACTQVASATSGGVGSGLNELHFVTVSPDGASLYTASQYDDAVARFDRDGTNGALTYRGCITGDSQYGTGGSGACTSIPSASPGGANSGLDTLRAVVTNPDGKTVYVATAKDDGVARFDRDGSGALTYRDCTTGDESSAAACTKIASATVAGRDSGLDSPRSIVLSPDGASLYAGARDDSALARFASAAAPPPVDTTPPTIIAVSPADGSVGVARDAAVTVTFSEEMDKAPTQDVFSLTPTAAPAAEVIGAFSWNGTAMSFQPLVPLAPGTNYTATVTTGAKDAAGNALPAEKVWSFTTLSFTTASPAATVIQAGTLRGGTAADLAADDNVYYQVNSTNSDNRTATWYGRFTNIPNALSNLKVKYSGANSLTCNQRLQLKRWTDNAWVQLDNRSVGGTELQIEVSPAGKAADYVSGTSGDGDLQLRVRCTRSSPSFYASADLMQIRFDSP
jgi:6-phosphogluconolactonase (cycloisomerase 2 family)